MPHELWKPNEVDELNETLYDLVVNGGLYVCKKCGQYEAGLDLLCVVVD